MEQQNNDVPAPDFGNMEPVAWYLPSPEGDDSIFRDHRTVVACTGNKWEGFLPLYVAPPKDSTNHVAELMNRLEATQKINATLLEALNIIAGNRPCVDNLLGDADIARAAIARATEE